ncbi:hypothetical protein D3C86_1818640 [compost metagenome]
MLTRYVSHVCFPVERSEVVFTHGVEFDVTYQNQFVMFTNIELLFKVLFRIFAKTFSVL